ncbi:hypothetical protein C1646_768769 [Rhizophagus diaphanus]|nr:hypothetical protein C1646_768769 [Rhizophagus diaphanus] [Rhizophagus sp. MUCL 43196]
MNNPANPISQMLTGKDLLKQSLESKLRSDNQRDIIDLDSTTNEIWNSRLTTSQKNLFTSFADNANKNRTIELIARINTQQITKTEFENFFSLKSSILPLGVVYRGFFNKNFTFALHTNLNSFNSLLPSSLC